MLRSGIKWLLWASWLVGLGVWTVPAIGAGWEEHRAAGNRAFDVGEHARAIQQFEAAIYFGRKQNAPERELGLLQEDLTNVYLVSERFQRARSAIDRWDGVLAANPSGTWVPEQRAVRDQLAALLFEAVRQDQDVSDSPLPAKPDAQPEPVATTAPTTTTSPTATTSATKGSYAIHLVSMRTMESANTAWATLRKRYPSLLADKDLVVREIDLGDQGLFVRVLAAPYEDATSAGDACATLEPQDQYCDVMSIE